MRVVLFCLALALAGCAKGNAGAAVSSEPAPAPAQPAAPAELPAAADLAKPDAGEVSRSCTVDADCAVKNVGNCCGYYPACVAKDSPTFPERVKAECVASGTMSTCGFQEPAGCACVEGQCASTGAGLGGTGKIE